jgi:RNA polymerase sigma factor (sigma-70 family)
MGTVEQKHSQLAEDTDNELVKRRVALINAYQALPAYGSDLFWRMIEEPDLKIALPLEVLAKCVRVAIVHGDNTGRNRIMEVIFRRTQSSNEYWAYHMLNSIYVRPDERNILVHDLYADLCECVIRALMDIKRLFWEENFQHCLQFERKHAYQAFMTREGRRYHQQDNRTITRRIPRVLIESLDQPVMHADGELREPEIEDVRAQQALLSVEQSDLPLLILQLPEKLRSVIWLIFWEGRTEKDAAQILGITDRTIRNRLREALKSLRNIFDSQEEGTTYG